MVCVLPNPLWCVRLAFFEVNYSIIVVFALYFFGGESYHFEITH